MPMSPPQQPGPAAVPMVGGMVGHRVDPVARRHPQRHGHGTPGLGQRQQGQEHQHQDQPRADQRGRGQQRLRPLVVQGMQDAEGLDAVQHEAVQQVLGQRPGDPAKAHQRQHLQALTHRAERGQRRQQGQGGRTVHHKISQIGRAAVLEREQAHGAPCDARRDASGCRHSEQPRLGRQALFVCAPAYAVSVRRTVSVSAQTRHRASTHIQGGRAAP